MQEDVYQWDGLNLYAYCKNNPVMYYDPSGYDLEYNSIPYIDPSSLPRLLAKKKKNTPGIVTGSATSSKPKMNKIRSDDLTIINIPPEIAKDLIDKQFDTFDELKVEIYKKIGNSKYANEFILGNQKTMKSVKAPFAPVSLQTGKNFNQVKYNIHHRIPVENGGDVYNLDNLIIVAPKIHDEIHAQLDAQNKASSCKKK